jgi:hypothetical protein
MIINFDIIDIKVDLTRALTKDKDWWFSNSLPQIPLETELKDLTDDQKISLIKLAIYEGYLDSNTLCNASHNNFKVK